MSGSGNPFVCDWWFHWVRGNGGFGTKNDQYKLPPYWCLSHHRLSRGSADRYNTSISRAIRGTLHFSYNADLAIQSLLEEEKGSGCHRPTGLSRHGECDWFAGVRNVCRSAEVKAICCSGPARKAGPGGNRRGDRGTTLDGLDRVGVGTKVSTGAGVRKSRRSLRVASLFPIATI